MDDQSRGSVESLPRRENLACFLHDNGTKFTIEIHDRNSRSKSLRAAVNRGTTVGVGIGIGIASFYPEALGNRGIAPTIVGTINKQLRGRN
ncbi:MAG: hypothetical protein HC780_06925 [Leptolyngbyaceae cyanobacterium CSU_1_3]|nr:hypothetical protein [Leptolyngbyaceae cyanobacterium CSU_1_3]